MAVYMLDTDIASYIMKRSNDAVLRKLQATPVSAICISAIAESELRFGVEVSPRRRRDQEALEALLRYLQVFDYPAAASLDYGQIRAFLKARGVMIGANDLLIAAHARCLGMTLVTNNTREFRRVPGLKIENWA
ncbi:MAG: type II toxin-antitoxin system VapC family toxin [Acidobacteriota bacterium]|nr:type II toxin-antitoxin system VapC family toxin [Acidobacteriota bacterium]